MGLIIEPLTFTTLDGKARAFRLTMREMLALGRSYGADLRGITPAEIGRVLYESLVDRAELSEDDFLAILPPDPALLLGFWKKLLEHFNQPYSDGANEKYRLPFGEISAINGSGSGGSGSAVWVDPTPNSGN